MSGSKPFMYYDEGLDWYTYFFIFHHLH